MSFRTVLVIVLALVCGVTAAMGISTLMRPRQAPAAEIETVPVVVAVADIGRFTTITPDLVKVRNFPKDTVPDKVISRADDVYGRALIYPMASGEAFVEGRLGDKGGARGIAAILNPGMRACTILTSSLAANVAGFILPGSKVDVHLILNTPGGANDPTGGSSTFVLLEDVEILAVQQIVVAPNENRVDPNQLQSVTLLVTQPQAEELLFAAQKGTLQLSLRNPNDKVGLSHRVVTVRDLHPLGAPPAKTEETQEPPKVEPVVQEDAPRAGLIRIIRGSTETQVTVQTAVLASAPKQDKAPNMD